MLAKINSFGARMVSVRGARTVRAVCRGGSAWFFLLALMLALSGCTPAGPRALLKGKKFLDRGNAAAAVVQFKRATTLLATNANAWNYLGVALQRAGEPDDAAVAYQTALKLDRDLVEAHYNLGCLLLEQSKPDAAKAEFTTYTLRRPNEAAGWLKLGSAQLRAGEITPAERSFSTVYHMDTSNPDALNGLGLARVQRGKPREAAQFFAAAVQSRADFAPALLNLATVSQQYLRDNKAALENYRAYLALTPRPANYDEVKALVSGLEQTDVATTVMTPGVVIKTSAPPTETKPKNPSVATQHLAAATTRPPSEEKSTPRVAPRTTAVLPPEISESPVAAKPVQTVQVQPEPQVIATPKTNPPMTPVVNVPVRTPSPATNAANPQESLEVPTPEEQPHRGFFRRLFGSDNRGASQLRARPENVTPIPAGTDEIAGTKPANEKPATVTRPATPSFPRYAFLSPSKPAAGDRRGAEGAFTKARLAEQDEKWPDALQWYQTAADVDPSWFEAQYNTGVIAHRLRNYSSALPRYELALALQPDSVDARYNFALALKAAGYAPDAADEFKKILAANPEEVRAHLALANLCAQSLHDTAQARRHYLKVLELQPDNPQANDIRFWLSTNAK